MYTCDHCRDQMWDDLFGLLEPSQSEELRCHILGCSDCRAEMEVVRAEHRLVAAAARLEVEIPPFMISAVEAAELVADSPRPKFAPPGRPFRVMPWLAAAAALLMIGLPAGFYQYGRLRYQTAWRDAENRLSAIVKEREELQSQAKAEREDMVRIALANHPRVQAVGPAAYQVGAVSSYHVWVSDVEGRAVDVPITARLLEDRKPILLDSKSTADKGRWLVDLPATLPLTPENTPYLELLPQGQKDAAPSRVPLRVLEPAYRTQLAVDRPVYQAGDTIHFRSLTLERFGLKIPGREFTAIYTLTDVQGQELQTVRGLTRKDGLGGGEFGVSPNWPAGEYRLTVREAQNRFPPATCRFPVGPIAPDLGKAAQDQRLDVEFFPEGGDLVAEVDNHVYFRVRSSLNQPADLQGAIVDSQGHEIVAVSTVGQKRQTSQTAGLGMFTLRPRDGEGYRLEVASPQGVAIHAPFPPARTTSVGLSLPNAVGGPNEPFRAIIKHTGPQRNLVVGLFCQGRLVAQELVAAASGATEVRLTPTLPCSGVFRVTVFEERQGQLWPLAERLAYRRPEKQLVLSVRGDKDVYDPGETVRLNLRSLNEQGKPEPAWLLVSVVNQAAWPRDTNSVASSLPAYFHLISELPQPEELERANILLRDSPEAATALDLFLGTQGWRRFQDDKADTTFVMAAAGRTRRAQDLAIPAIVQLDNRAETERRFATALSERFADWQEKLTRRDHELASKGAEQLRIARTAVQQFDAYEQRAGGLIQRALGLGGVTLFAVGCLLLGTVLSRVIRGLGTNRSYLAGAFAALSLCALILWGQAASWGEARKSTNLAKITGFAAEIEKRFDVAALSLPANQKPAPSQAFSKGTESLSREAFEALSGKSNTGIAQQGQSARSVPTNRPPWIGILRAVPSSQPGAAPNPVQNVPLPVLRLRVYSYDPSREPAWSRATPSTIFWQPILFTRDGIADVSFTLPAGAATYRILAAGHNAVGRLGAVQGTLECRLKR